MGRSDRQHGSPPPRVTLYKTPMNTSTGKIFRTYVLNEDDVDNELRKIVMPSDVKSRGRPKGTKKTTVSGIQLIKGPKCFDKLSKKQKIEKLLGWIVPADYVEPAQTHEYDITINDLRYLNPKDICDALIAPGVDISIICNCYENDAWAKLMTIIDEKKKKNLVLCHICRKSLGRAKKICCSCKLGYHAKCIGQKVDEDWACSSCCDES